MWRSLCEEHAKINPEQTEEGRRRAPSKLRSFKIRVASARRLCKLGSASHCILVWLRVCCAVSS
eukprot:4075250-Pleurochrysis_carterae.AAC.1